MMDGPWAAATRCEGGLHGDDGGYRRGGLSRMTYRFEGGTESSVAATSSTPPERERAPWKHLETLSLSLSLSDSDKACASLAGQLHVKGIYHLGEDEPIDRFKRGERTTTLLSFDEVLRNK